MKNIYICKTRLPSRKRYNDYLKRIWKSNWLTNNGELVQELEKKLEKRFGVKHVVCVSSGTAALLIALRAMGIRELQTSPFSFIATVSAPLWEGVKVTFVDEVDSFDRKIPVLLTHVYGVPNLVDHHPVIYDASHAFGVKINGKSILTYGDCSIISFHAVKIFQTIEGGAVVTNNDEIAAKARWMRNYGFKTHYSFQGVGVNFKMNEFEAAMGLCSLELVDDTLKRYDKIIDRYNEALGFEWTQVTYYPVFLEDEPTALRAMVAAKRQHIYLRRYFYPPLNTVFSNDSCPIYESLSKRVICLPLYYDLSIKDQERVIQVIRRFI